MKYGTYPFDVDGVHFTTTSETLFNDAKIPYAWRCVFRVFGLLLGSGQADLTAKSLALETALAIPFKDLVFLQTGGAESASVLKNAGSLGGVVITRGPDFGGTKGWEYATAREFSFEAMAEYPTDLAGTGLLSFTETVQFSGGGPLYVLKPAINGPPQRQLIYQQTAYVATQAGSAVGYRSYPIVPGPLWPAALKEAPHISYSAPERHGLTQYEKFRTSWQYVHESATALVGSPNLWIR